MDEGAMAAGELGAPHWENLSIFMLITAAESGVFGIKWGWPMLLLFSLGDLKAFTGIVRC